MSDAPLNLEQAAAFLGIHKNTLQPLAKSGEVPGCKIGKEWRFIKIDLIEYMRAQYPANKAEPQKCQKGLGNTARRGGSTSTTMGDVYAKALAQARKPKPAATATNSKHASGRSHVRLV